MAFFVLLVCLFTPPPPFPYCLHQNESLLKMLKTLKPVLGDCSVVKSFIVKTGYVVKNCYSAFSFIPLGVNEAKNIKYFVLRLNTVVQDLAYFSSGQHILDTHYSLSC